MENNFKYILKKFIEVLFKLYVIEFDTSTNFHALEMLTLEIR